MSEKQPRPLKAVAREIKEVAESGALLKRHLPALSGEAAERARLGIRRQGERRRELWREFNAHPSPRNIKNRLRPMVQRDIKDIERRIVTSTAAEVGA